jgi:hypothetical protein
MSGTKRCSERFEDLVALVMGELVPAAERELRDHVAGCDGCRAALDALLEEEKQVRAGFAAVARRLAPIERAVLKGRHVSLDACVDVFDGHLLERAKDMIRGHRGLIVAAAAATGLAASVVLWVWTFSFSSPAYALEQTVEANARVRSYHAKLTPAKELGEVWVELSADGAPIRARWDLQSPDDGFKVVVLSEGKAEIWFKDKKSHVFVPEEDGLRMVMRERSVFDPKLAFEQLQAQIKAGNVQVETKEPTAAGEPVTLTVTPKKDPDNREVYEIAPTTKLVERMTRYRQRDGRWEQVVRIQYLDYNKPIDPAVFRLDVPEDVMTIDQINRKPGLEKGDLSDTEMAKKVVREFFEALIAGDYDKAGLIYEGIPGEKMKEGFGRMKFLRIVEIGEPVAGKHPDKTALAVTAKVEWEVGGQREVKELTAYVRAPHRQPERRVICGGI